MKYRWLVLTVVFVAVCLPALGAGKESVKTIVPAPGSEEAKQFTKHEVVTDSAGHRLRVIHYLTDAYAQQTGFTVQIDEYDPKGYPARFTMISTKDYESITGFSKRTDYVDENDTLLKADFYVGDTYVFTASADDLKAFSKYPLYRMGRYYEENHSETIKENEYTIETPVFAGTTYVTYLNSTRQIGPHEKYLIASWSKMHGANEFVPVYNKEVLIKEGSKRFWICFQDDLLQYLVPDLKMTVRYYYIGETVEGMTFLVTFMTEIHATPPGAAVLSQMFEQGARITSR